MDFFLVHFLFPNLDYVDLMILYMEILVCTWRHGVHVRVENDSDQSLLGIWLYCYSKLEGHFAVVLYTNTSASPRELNPRAVYSKFQCLHVHKYTEIIKQTENSPESTTWSALGKQDLQAKSVDSKANEVLGACNSTRFLSRRFHTPIYF